MKPCNLSSYIMYHLLKQIIIQETHLPWNAGVEDSKILQPLLPESQSDVQKRSAQRDEEDAAQDDEVRVRFQESLLCLDRVWRT